MLDEQRAILKKNFPRLVRECDLQKIMCKISATEIGIKEIMDKLSFTSSDSEGETSYRHNNRLILFKYIENLTDNLFYKLAKTLRDYQHYDLADRLENKTTKPSKHLTNCFKLPDDVLKSLPATIADQLLQINIHYSTAFTDDDKSYTTRSKNRGHILLINNINFRHEDAREGAEVDEHNLRLLFAKMAFTIFGHRDLSAAQMRAEIAAFARMREGADAPDICLFIVMSHGQRINNKTEVICSDGRTVEEDWIIDQFNNDDCPLFRRRPKILIFHICRGKRLDHLLGRRAQHTETDSACTRGPGEEERYLSDVLVCHPSLEGFRAHRDTLKGCWYIELLCRVFMENAHEMDIERMLKSVEDKLKRRVSENYTRQTSTFLNIAFRNCFLNPGIYEEHGKVVPFEYR